VEKIKFDDIEALQAKVSDDFGPWSDSIEVTQDMINQFAELTGDRQWIHIDVERCKKESPFGGPIAHGFLTLSLLPGMRPKPGDEPEWAVTGYGNAVNYGAEKLRFLSPVPAGSKLHSRSRLVAVEAGPKGTRMVRETALHVVGSEKPAILYTMIVLYQPPRSQ
jgi:acyl dehydratase